MAMDRARGRLKGGSLLRWEGVLLSFDSLVGSGFGGKTWIC